MKKFLISAAFVALTAGSAFAQGGSITVGGNFNPGAVTFGSVSNSATQSLTTTVRNNSPATAGNATASTGAGAMGTATALSAASTVNTQTVTPTNAISFTNSLAQTLNY
ncbi:hypothetical protein OGR47_09210 [Methylocystis sp. MJC1]|jgi:hypothetical protein|uniref:hypothetical protein n=1 Tax=Methylocystis sp. MJC1 TaxID=2654282 RepID=UPI0013E9CFDF|nr:hypothetical protein [Methylocystis sp. MJC1]KAF2991596.1 hypothetical protein MJC1_01161 [Methylocystis sp. MJC1]MBU6527165.1 hypothetical protein [Methylocystis sp. MJC1]UZX13598.1 hypothetical protein OGR47_09210 [Methylocystis sp. MJC1]